MARMRDENKRIAILQSSKMLFSQKGFYNTSISDIVQETGLQVGTIYTYFKSKDEIVRAIVDEGWEALFSSLVGALSSVDSPEDKLKLLIDRFMPELLKDVALINILLSEAVTYTHLEDKVEKLTDMLFSIMKSLMAKGKGALTGFSRDTLKTTLLIYFLGIMNTVKIARQSSLGISDRDVVASMRVLIRESLGISL
jgi:AcrR family transcriptional regulator